MKCNSAYKIDVNHKIVFHSYKGEIGINDIKENLKRIISSSGYSKNFDQIVDFRFCKLVIDIDELPDFVNFVKNEIEIDAVRKDLYLTSKPNEVVVSTLFGMLIESFKIEPHVVSTLEMIIQILLKPDFRKSNLESILNGLKIR